jgi:N-acetylmuramoyl-L-alanine amidase
MKYPIILIDNGHGKETAGKRSPDGKLREYRWTRNAAREIVEQLREKGIDAFLLTPEEEDITLQKRVSRVEAYCRQYGKQNIIMISVHCNAFGDGVHWTSPKGWSAYTTKGVTRSDDIAKVLYKHADLCFPDRKIRRFNGHDNPDYEEQFYILRKTSCPAVLTENFFMTNEDDYRYLLSEEGMSAVVKCHVDALLDYIDNL